MDATTLSRLHFAFTAAYHYLFPPLTMGLALLLVVLKTQAVWRRDELANQAVRFWSRLFAVTFIMGVVTGIPLEFQFGTNWARFSAFSGNIIAQTLAMEGAYAFFLESAFVGLLLFGERRFGQTVHWFAAFTVFLGTWASGFFIIASNAWTQNPVGFIRRPDGGIELSDYWAVLFNPWIAGQYLHTMTAAVLTAAFVMAGLGAYYRLLGQHVRYARLFVQLGVLVGLAASILQLTPTGLALFFGVAIANVVRGVPLDSEGYFFEPLWTNLDPRNPTPGILDWYTVLIGLLAFAALVVHGANFTALKTEGPVHDRARRFARWWWLVTLVLTVLGTLATFWLRPMLLANFGARPWGLVFPAVAIAGLMLTRVFNTRDRDMPTFAASGAYLVGMLASTAFAVYPDVLPAVDPSRSLTISNAASPLYSLTVGLVWWSIAVVLAAIYFVVIYRLFRGKVRMAHEGY